MTGRQEHDNEIEERIKKRLKNTPLVVKKYMTSIASLTAATRNVYLGYIIDFLGYLNKEYGIDGSSFDEFDSIKKMDIDGYIEYTKINPKTGKANGTSIRNSKISAAISFFGFLEDNDLITKNPCSNIKKLKDNKERELTYLTREEIDDVKAKILSYGRGVNYEDPWRFRDYAIFVLGCSTGLRNSAIREINLSDLDLKNRKVIVTEKDSVTKIVLLNDNTCDAIRQWMIERERLLTAKGKESQALFISNQMRRMTDVTLQAVMKKYTSDMDKHITPHKMRSTCGMHVYLASGGNMALTAKVLGHKNIRNTQIYADATNEQLREASDIMNSIV